MTACSSAICPYRDQFRCGVHGVRGGRTARRVTSSLTSSLRGLRDIARADRHRVDGVEASGRRSSVALDSGRGMSGGGILGSMRESSVNVRSREAGFYTDLVRLRMNKTLSLCSQGFPSQKKSSLLAQRDDLRFVCRRALHSVVRRIPGAFSLRDPESLAIVVTMSMLNRAMPTLASSSFRMTRAKD